MPSQNEPNSQALGKLLIIEDAEIHSAIIARTAAKVGFTVASAHCYEDACYLLRARQFDCITLDLGLGQHAGVDVLNYLSTIGCKTPVIITSASDKDVCDGTVRIGKSLGLNICVPVPKPIDLKALRETLAHIRMHVEMEKLASNPVAQFGK
jgi:DNA-binding response OmpR family regulator